MKKNLFKVIDILEKSNLSIDDLYFSLDIIVSLYHDNLHLANLLKKEVE